MRILKSLTFIFLVVGVFIYYYKRSSHKSRLKRFTASLRLVIIVAAASANLIGNPQPVNAFDYSSTIPAQEQVQSNQNEFIESEKIHNNKLNERTQKSDIALELRGGDYPFASPLKFGITDPAFKIDPMARGHKSGPGARGRALGRTAAQNRAAQRKSGGIRGVDAYTTSHQGFCKYHGSKMQSCLTRKATQTPFDNPGDNPGSPPSSPTGLGSGPSISPPHGSAYQNGLSPFKGVFKYDSSFSADKIDFKDQKSMGHMFDGHAKKALNIQENKNKQTLQQMQDKLVAFSNEPDTICLEGSFNYKRPAYIFAKPYEKRSDNDLIFAVDANTNRPILVINGTDSQFERVDKPDHNLGKDRRPQKDGYDDNEHAFGHMVLRLRGPQ